MVLPYLKVLSHFHVEGMWKTTKLLRIIDLPGEIWSRQLLNMSEALLLKPSCFVIGWRCHSLCYECILKSFLWVHEAQSSGNKFIFIMKMAFAEHNGWSVNKIVSSFPHVFRAFGTSSPWISGKWLWKCWAPLYAIMAPGNKQYWGFATAFFHTFPVPSTWQVSLRVLKC
jgi:hypothetical protein